MVVGGIPDGQHFRQNNTIRPSARHSAERQLLIASGGPQSMSQQNNTELQKGFDFSLCMLWLEWSHLSASAVM